MLMVHFIDLFSNSWRFGPVQWLLPRALPDRVLIAKLVFYDVDRIVAMVAISVVVQQIVIILVFRSKLSPWVLASSGHKQCPLTLFPTTSKQVIVWNASHNWRVILRSIKIGLSHFMLVIGHFIALSATVAEWIFFLVKHLLVDLKSTLVEDGSVWVIIPGELRIWVSIDKDQAALLSMRQSVANRTCLEGLMQVLCAQHIWPLLVGSFLHIQMHPLLWLLQKGLFLHVRLLQLSHFLLTGELDFTGLEWNGAEWNWVAEGTCGLIGWNVIARKLAETILYDGCTATVRDRLTLLVFFGELLLLLLVLRRSEHLLSKFKFIS